MFVAKCVALLSLALATNAKIPDFIKPCHIEDNECIHNSAKIALPYLADGYPDYGINSYDPLTIPTVDGDNGDMKLQMSNLVVNGLKNTEIVSIKRTNRLQIDLDLLCSISASGGYKLDGSVLLLPTTGNGKFDITIPKLKLKMTIKLKVIQKNGVDYYKIASFDFQYQPQEKGHINFQNLYGGDEEKGNQMNQFMNDNYEVLINDVAKPLITKIVTVPMRELNGMFEKMPCKEMELD